MVVAQLSIAGTWCVNPAIRGEESPASCAGDQVPACVGWNYEVRGLWLLIIGFG